MSYYPQLRASFIIWIRSELTEYGSEHYIAQPPFHHSPTLKPLDHKNNGFHATVIKLLSKDF